MEELTNQFHNAMIDIYKSAREDCNYTATRFLQMLSDHGGLATAKKLLSTESPSDGFTKLWEYERLDLTVEAHVIKPEYAPLFVEEEINTARKRLEEYGYTFI